MEKITGLWPEWQIESVLGEGSFGKVYKIKREDVGGTFYAALKEIRIPKDKSEIQTALAEGMDEVSTTAYFRSIMEEIVKEFALMEQLKGNTNIVSYEDHKVVPHEDGYGWTILIRMELLTPLTQYMRFNKVTEDMTVKIGMDMCRALEMCERHKVIHRDIKPENIFVSRDGDFKLGDFGVARTAEKTMSNMSKKGTYTYMAPEVYKGESYNATVDIYSLGIVLYRLLNDNRAPFLPPAPQPITYSDRENALEKRLSGAPIPDPLYGNAELKAVIRKACAYRSANRYQTAAELRKALESAANSSAKSGTNQTVTHNTEQMTEPAAEPEKTILLKPDAAEESEETISAFASSVPKDASGTAQESKPEKPKKPNWKKLKGVLAGIVFAAVLVTAIVVKVREYANMREFNRIYEELESTTGVITDGGYRDVSYTLFEDGTLMVWGSGELPKTLYGSNLENAESVASWLAGYTSNIKTVYFAVRKCTDLSGAFKNCTKLEYVDFSASDLSSVTDMSYMFNYCVSLKDVNGLAGADVGAVTNMSRMFCRCFTLASVDGLIDWDVSKVADMSAMFYGCKSLTDVSGLENWSVSGDANVKVAFEGCDSLTSYPSWYQE